MSKFLVQNTSSERKKVTIFGLSISPGIAADLMVLPNVNEQDITNGLSRGELRNKLLNGNLTVLECTILIPSGDAEFSEFLNKIGIGSRIKPEGTSKYVTQSNWFINANNGNDYFSGETPDKALKTWGEWQRRVGLAVLKPTGNLLSIRLLSDLPSSDPITFSNAVAPEVSVRITGTKKVLATGTFGAVEDRDRSFVDGTWPAGRPFTATVNDPEAPADYWTQYVGKVVWVTSGDAVNSRAPIARDLGSKKAHLGSWFTGLEENGLPNNLGEMFPAAIPVEGDTFEIVEYTGVSFGFSNDTNLAFPEPYGPPLCKLLEQVTVNSYNNGVVNAIADYITNAQIEVWDASFIGLANGVHNFPILVDPPAWMQIMGGLWLGVGLEIRGQLALDGDPTFMSLPDFRDSFLLTERCSAHFGPMSFWESPFHTLVITANSSIEFEGNSPLFGESNYVPLWGTGSTVNGELTSGRMFVFGASSLVFNSFSDNGDNKLPNMLLGHFDVPNAVSEIGDIDGYAIAWDEDNAAFLPKRPLTWSSLAEPTDGYGFVYKSHSFELEPDLEFGFPGAVLEFTFSAALDPSTGSKLIWRPVKFTLND